jgi:hypothetical protein
VSQGISELSAAVYSQATPKLVHGKPMTGPILLQLLEAAVNAVNTPGQRINLPTVWGALVARELQAAASAARQVYKSATSSLDDCVDLPAAVEMHKVRANGCLYSTVADYDIGSTWYWKYWQAACWQLVSRMLHTFQGIPYST